MTRKLTKAEKAALDNEDVMESKVVPQVGLFGSIFKLIPVFIGLLFLFAVSDVFLGNNPAYQKNVKQKLPKVEVAK